MVAFLSFNAVSASDLNLTDDYSLSDNNIIMLNAENSQNLKESPGNSVTINVKDSYIDSSNSWSEDGVSASGALVQIFNSNSNLVYQSSTDYRGSVQTALSSGNYNLKINYDSYEEYSESFTVSNSPVTINHVFYPDILFFVDYTSHNEKIDILMNYSKRVCFISTTSYDKTQEWLFDYANFIQVDMYASGVYSFDINVLKNSPAYANYMIAYTFGVYDDSLINSIDLHFIGASKENNSYNTIENTYIGSYFQAEDTPDLSVLNNNMANLLDYIKYLIDPSEYDNPTLDSTRTPLVASDAGFYHPDYGTLTLTPSQELINSWILTNPGYNDDGIGSLNWKTGEYAQWQIENLNAKNLMQTFENWYKKNKVYNSSFIVISSYYAGGDVIDALIRELESKGRPAFNIYQSSTTPSMSSMLIDASAVSKMGISAVISLYSWSLDYANGSAEHDLSELNLTVVKGVYDISQESYNNELGPQMEWTYQVTIPGFEGVFGAVVISYLDDLGNSIVIQSGVEKLVKLAIGWADLKDSSNADKEITIVLYNYPPGKAEIGASYLDVFQSTYDLLIQLYLSGYDLGINNINEFPTLAELTETITNFGNKGSWAQGLLNEYVEKNRNYLMEHNQLISLDEFYELTSDVNSDLMKELVDYWGDGLGEVMVYNNEYIVIPGIHFGNVFITFQPSRGWEEVENYHDTTLPPHQQYVAFYEWLDKKLDTDAIVYMGTHGTLEFLPGHSIGVQEGDWTFELTLTPSIYVYIVSNPGEAMVAKDRISALMITHMTPAIVASELYGNYSTLSQAIDGYNNAVKLNVSNNAESYKEQILVLAKNLGFDLPAENQSFDEWLDDLHDYLDEMENDINALGLHSIGKILTGEELVEEVVTIVSSKTEIYNNIISILYPQLAGYDYFDDLKGNSQYAIQVSHAKAVLYEIVRLMVNGTSAQNAAGLIGYSTDSALFNDTVYISEVIQNIRANNEWNALMQALSGSYVYSGLFADPAYGDSIPTGNDGYAVDHTKVPSKASYDSAKRIIDMLLADYYENHGSWPELIGLVLWGTEISRTEGIGISEYLYLLGCIPTWTYTGTVDGVELLPLEDLKVKLSNGTVVNRPRVDVYASMVTSNKNWITWMVTATNLAFNAAGEDASNNYVKKHYAENPSLDRLFGLPGNILEGTGMSTLIPNTADWDIETINEVLADIYMNKVSYAWNLDENGNIVISQQKDDYAFLLGKTDMITQNFDSTWRLFDSDDYYDWFGGLLNAAKHYGADPETAFVDIRNKNEYTYNSYEEEIYFEIRSFLINPKYVNELIKTDAGFNSWASKYQNLYGSMVVAGASINSNMGMQMAESISSVYSAVDSTTKAAAFSSASAWMLYSAFNGLWEMSDANGNPVDSSFTKLLSSDSISVSDVNKFVDSLSPEMRAALQDLANKYIDATVRYDVACCHHTCNNLNFNKMAMVISTLSQSEKKAFSDRLSQATLTQAIYEQLYDGSENQGSESAEGNTDISDSPSVLVNGTDSSNGGVTDFGNLPSQESNSQVASSDSSSSASAQESQSPDSGAGANGQTAYELSKKSVSKSSANPESSMPAYFIAGVVVLLVLFGFGFYRRRE